MTWRRWSFTALFVFLVFTAIVTAQTGTLRGTVVDKQTQAPLVGVNILVQGTEYGAATDSEGEYVIPGVEVGLYAISYSMIGYEQRVITDIQILSDHATSRDVELRQSYVESQDEVTVTANSYFSKEEEAPVSYRNLNYEEVRRSPGAREDVSRMVQNLPGVAPTTDDRNDLVIRGGSPTEVLYMVDNIEIPNPNHFPTQGATGGPISMLNTEFIREVNFMAGGFPAKYGHRLSGVLDIHYREGNREQYGGKFDLSFAGAGGNFEGPIQQGKGAWMFAFHRSFLDFLDPLLDFGGTPIYSNAQVKAVYDLASDTKLSLLGIGGTDRIHIDPKPAAEDFETGEIDTLTVQDVVNRNQQWTFGGTLSKIWREDLHSKWTISHSYYRFFTDVNLDDEQVRRPETGEELDIEGLASHNLYDNTSTEQTTSLKSNWTYLLNSRDEIGFGGYAKLFQFDHQIRYTPHDERNSVGEETAPNTVNRSEELNPKLGGYVNFSKGLGEGIQFNLGLRYDCFDLLGTHDLSPRFSVSYRVNKHLTFNGAAGAYRQRPDFIFITGHPSNDENLTSIRSNHYVLGADYLLSEGAMLSVEVYRKNYDHYPISADPDYPFYSTINSGASYGSASFSDRLVSDGIAQASGIELLLQKKMLGDFYGTISYSLSKIEYQAMDDMWRPGSFDSPNVLNIVGGYRLNKHWEFSLKWRYADGRPYTPYDKEASVQAGQGRIDTDRINGERFDPYHRLDLRFDHRSYFDKMTLVSYFSIENVYNRQNQSHVQWSSDREEAIFAYQTGFFPVGGFSLEF